MARGGDAARPEARRHPAPPADRFAVGPRQEQAREPAAAALDGLPSRGGFHRDLRGPRAGPRQPVHGSPVGRSLVHPQQHAVRVVPGALPRHPHRCRRRLPRANEDHVLPHGRAHPRHSHRRRRGSAAHGSRRRPRRLRDDGVRARRGHAAVPGGRCARRTPAGPAVRGRDSGVEGLGAAPLVQGAVGSPPRQRHLPRARRRLPAHVDDLAPGSGGAPVLRRSTSSDGPV